MRLEAGHHSTVPRCQSCVEGVISRRRQRSHLVRVSTGTLRSLTLNLGSSLLNIRGAAYASGSSDPRRGSDGYKPDLPSIPGNLNIRASADITGSSSVGGVSEGFQAHSSAALSSIPFTEEARMDSIEAWIENRIFNCRFLTLFAVIGALVGATLCFVKGSLLVSESVKVFAYHCIRGINTGRVILLLVEALDVYLIATIMLIFGLGLYELFVDTLEPPSAAASSLLRSQSSSLFGLFPLRARPKWLEIHSLDQMKTKLGHVIVMILLVGMFEKSKKVAITTATDYFLFSASVALAAICLYLLSKLASGNALEDIRH